MKRVLFISLLLLALATLAARYWPGNYAYLLLSKGYGAAGGRQTLRPAWRLACAATEATGCEAGNQADARLLPLVDDYYLERVSPLYVVTDTVQLGAADLQLGGPFALNQIADDRVTMFGEGWLDARLFLLAEEAAEWRIGVTAAHDSPPPVHLEVWMDDERLGTLAFDKGDQSWETLSVSGKIKPHFHRLTIWFVNDYRDVEANLDRNAYIERVTITHSD